MNCDEFLERLPESAARLDEDQRAHARVCPACAALFDDAPQPVPPAALTDAVRARLASDLKPVRVIASEQTLILRMLFILIVVVVAGSAVVGVHTHRGLPVVVWMLLYGCLVVGAIGAAVSLPRKLIPGARATRGGLAAVIGLLLFATIAAAALGEMPVRSWLRAGVGCLILGSIWGLVAGAGVWLALRRGFWAGMHTGVLAGLAAGIAALAGLTLHCPILDVSHVLVWHGAAVLLLAVLGALAIPKTRS